MVVIAAFSKSRSVSPHRRISRSEFRLPKRNTVRTNNRFLGRKYCKVFNCRIRAPWNPPLAIVGVGLSSNVLETNEFKVFAKQGNGVYHGWAVLAELVGKHANGSEQRVVTA